jgi:hypothetical protein
MCLTLDKNWKKKRKKYRNKKKPIVAYKVVIMKEPGQESGDGYKLGAS